MQKTAQLELVRLYAVFLRAILKIILYLQVTELPGTYS